MLDSDIGGQIGFSPSLLADFYIIQHAKKS